MSDADLPYGPPIVDADDDERMALHEEAIRSLTRVRTGATLLRVVAIVAAVIWLAALVSSTAITWHTIHQAEPTTSLNLPVEAPTSTGGWDVATVIVTAAVSTWGYGLIAVLALAGSVWIDRAQARDDLDVLEDGNDDLSDG